MSCLFLLSLLMMSQAQGNMIREPTNDTANATAFQNSTNLNASVKLTALSLFDAVVEDAMKDFSKAAAMSTEDLELAREQLRGDSFSPFADFQNGGDRQ